MQLTNDKDAKDQTNLEAKVPQATSRIVNKPLFMLVI